MWWSILWRNQAVKVTGKPMSWIGQFGIYKNTAEINALFEEIV